MIQKTQKKKDDPLVSILDFFLKPQLSQEDITQTAFTIQLQLSEFLSKSKTTKKIKAPKTTNNGQTIKDNFAEKCISIILHYLDLPRQNKNSVHRDQFNQIALIILNLIPSLIQKIDNGDQIYLTNLINHIHPNKSVQIELQLALFHSISEIIQTPDVSLLFRQKITEFIEFDSKFSPALLNICIFNFEIQKQYQKQWCSIIRQSFISSNNENLLDSAILLQSKRTCSKELCNALCAFYQNPTNVQHLDKLDFFLILLLTSINSTSTNKLLKYFVQTNRLKELTLKECKLNLIPINNMIDALYTISSSIKSNSDRTEELPRIISEMFAISETIEIFTFALFNEDENKVLLDATISAISLSVETSPQLFFSQFDSIGVLSTVSKQVCQKLIHPILKLSLSFSQLFDSLIVFLRKMAARPTWTDFVVNSLCYFLKQSAILQSEQPKKRKTRNSLQDLIIEHQTEVIDMISKLITSPYVRSRIFYQLSEICNVFDSRLKKQIQQIVNNYKDMLNADNFVDLLDNEYEQIATEGCVVTIKDIPASELKLLLSLGTKPCDFFYLIDLHQNGFDDSKHIAIQLALRAEVYCILSPFNNDAFMAFSEYLIAIDYYSEPEERKIIDEWCFFILDHSFVRDSLLKNSFTDPLLLYTLIRQISVFSSDVDIDLIEACRQLFIKTASCRSDIDSGGQIELTSHQVFCDFIPSVVFNDIVEQFREELTVEIAKFIDVQCPNPLDYKIFVEEMKMIQFHKGISSRHFDAFLKIFKKSLPISTESSELIFDLLTSLKIDDSKMFSQIINLALMKSPLSDALVIAQSILKNIVGEEKSIMMDRNPLKNAALAQLIKFVSSFDKINQDVFNLFYQILLLDNEIYRSSANNILNALNQMIKTLTLQIKNQNGFDLDEFKTHCQTWLNENKSMIGARQYGSTTAYLKMLNNSNNGINSTSDEYESDDGIENFGPAFDVLFEQIQKGEVTSKDDDDDINLDDLLLDERFIKKGKKKKKKKTTKLPRFVQRKWRSKSKFIDDGLKDETESDDNFADLEDFVVDESPPPEENEEEEDSSF